MTKKYDIVVFFSDFQVITHSDINAILELQQAAKQVVLILEGEEQPRNILEPFTLAERKSILQDLRLPGIIIRSINNDPYTTLNKLKNIQSIITDLNIDNTGTLKIAYISPYSNYEDDYKQLGWDELPSIGERSDLVKKTFLGRWYDENLNFTTYYGVVPQQMKFMKEFKIVEPMFAVLQREWNVLQQYWESWESSPYPPTFVTVDAAVVQSGHILLIQRKDSPGEGQWALPGGFLNQKETIIQGVVRELIEETRIKVAEKVLLGSITKSKVFDSPFRSLRGRTITHAYLIELAAGHELPKVKAADDAKKAKWFTFNEVFQMREKMFEDHFDMIQWLIGNNS